MRRSKVLLALCVLTIPAAGESNAGIMTISDYLNGAGYTDIASEFDFSTITPGTDISSDHLPAALKGYVHYDTGLHATENWADSNTTLFWDITPGAEWMNYRYTFYVAESEPVRDISHMIFQVSDDFGFDNVIGDIEFYYGEYADIPVENGQPYYDDIGGLTPKTLDKTNDDDVEIGIYHNKLGNGNRGLKIQREQDDDKIWTVEFQSDRVAMWGNFYAKDGGGSGILAYNTGRDDDSGVLIPVPNSETYAPPVPEPASLLVWLLLGASIVGLTAMRRRKHSRSI